MSLKSAKPLRTLRLRFRFRVLIKKKACMPSWASTQRGRIGCWLIRTTHTNMHRQLLFSALFPIFSCLLQALFSVLLNQPFPYICQYLISVLPSSLDFGFESSRVVIHDHLGLCHAVRLGEKKNKGMMVQNRLRMSQHLIHFPTSSEVRNWAVRANAWAQRSAWAKWIVGSKQCPRSVSKRANNDNNNHESQRIA